MNSKRLPRLARELREFDCGRYYLDATIGGHTRKLCHGFAGDQATSFGIYRQTRRTDRTIGIRQG